MTIQILLVQLPVPQLNFGRQTGNIPLGAACLKQAADRVPDIHLEIVSQVSATYLGDAALLDLILCRRPDVIGFTTYVWNVQRTLNLARRIKDKYSPRIIVGGPEVTPDNRLVHDDAIDTCIYGEGEHQFLAHVDALKGTEYYPEMGCPFSAMPSPYRDVPLDYRLEDTMLLETMRGCPYHCAYCYYNKSHGKPAFKPDAAVLDGVRFALNNDISEIYLLDPSLNSRPGLKALLRQIAAINRDRKISLISEIRAEAIDEELADLLQAAGFKWFEIGLQSTNPAALKQMRRSLDPDRFVRGARALKQRGITTAVDLIVGLPGDDIDGFDRSIQFVADNGLHEDIQVFPLALLPGTSFRQRHGQLGLEFERTPPYTIISTPTFSREDILLAFDHAESSFGLSLYPLPDLDVAWQSHKGMDIYNTRDLTVRIGEENLLYKYFLQSGHTTRQWSAAARRVSHPYQLVIPPDAESFNSASEALATFTRINPHTPLEMIFFSPPALPDVDELLRSAALDRPHYLDGDLRLLYREPGNRAILFTVVSDDVQGSFDGPMKRHIHWWRRPALPAETQLAELEASGYRGVLINAPVDEEVLCAWQDVMALRHEDLMLIDFATTRLHRRWIGLTAPGDYCLHLLP